MYGFSEESETASKTFELFDSKCYKINMIFLLEFLPLTWYRGYTLYFKLCVSKYVMNNSEAHQASVGPRPPQFGFDTEASVTIAPEGKQRPYRTPLLRNIL